MPTQRRIIIIVNQDLARHPELRHLKNPVTVEHTMFDCPKCGDTCWIGPTQLQFANLGPAFGGEVLCYKCFNTDQDLKGHTVSVIPLNPNIENAQRRFT